MFLALEGFWLVVVSIIAFVLILGVLICVHELGHLFFAKRAGVLCHEFSFGMGPLLFQRRKGETLYSIRAIPIGGYVSMAGEQQTDDFVKKGLSIGINLEGEAIKEIILDDNRECQIRGDIVDSDIAGKDGNPLFITLLVGDTTYYYNVKKDAEFVFEKDKRLQIEPYDRTLDSKSFINRFMTLFAGAMNNFILAILIFILISFINGVPDKSSNVIGSISGSEYPAYNVLNAGDEIELISGHTISSWDDVSKALEETYKTSTTVTIKVKGKEEVSLEALTIIQSAGISNVGAKKLTAITNEDNIKDNNGNLINGLMLGKVSFLDKIDVKANDIISKINIDYNEADEKNGLADVTNLKLESWLQLSKLFDEITSEAHVSFEYYEYNKTNDQETYTLKTSGQTRNYTNEVLDNQRIDKIEHYIGIACRNKFDFFGCLGNAFVSFWDNFTLIFRTIGLLIAPQSVRQIGVNNLSSVVGIYSLVQRYVSAGVVALLGLAAMLSVNLGVVNLLPIPALDGGRIVFLLIEKITRKSVPKKVENIINTVFLILILALFVYITVHDIIRLF